MEYVHDYETLFEDKTWVNNNFFDWRKFVYAIPNATCSCPIYGRRHSAVVLGKNTGTTLGPIDAEHRNVRWVNNQSCYVVSGTTGGPADDTPTTTTPTTDTGGNILPLCLEQTGNANGWAWNGGCKLHWKQHACLSCRHHVRTNRC